MDLRHSRSLTTHISYVSESNISDGIKYQKVCKIFLTSLEFEINLWYCVTKIDFLHLK